MGTIKPCKTRIIKKIPTIKGKKPLKSYLFIRRKKTNYVNASLNLNINNLLIKMSTTTMTTTTTRKRSLIELKDSLKVEFIKLLKRWLLTSKTHGLDRLASSRHFLLKLIWLSCLLLAIGTCVYSEIETFASFREYDVTTKIRESYQNEITFPAISICNANSMPTPNADAYIREFYAQKYNNVSIESYAQFYDLLRNDTVKDEFAYIQYSTYHPDFDTNVRASFGYREIIACTFNNVKCTLSDFVEYYDAVYGNCLRFNGNNWNFTLVANESETIEEVMQGRESTYKQPFTANIQDSGFWFAMYLGSSEPSNLGQPSNIGYILYKLLTKYNDF